MRAKETKTTEENKEIVEPREERKEKEFLAMYDKCC